jgi:hypothetical protein
MRLIRFEDINGNETFINPDCLNFISDFGSGKTELNFGGKEAVVYVEMEVAAVAKTLLKATADK